MLDFKDDKKRMIYFLFGCIGLRSLMAYVSYLYGNKLIGLNLGLDLKLTWNKLFGLFTLIAGLGFLILYYGRMRLVAPETGGKKVWWNKIRHIHGILYLLFTASVFFSDKVSIAPWKLLTTDVLVGLAFYLHRKIISVL